VKKWAPIMVVWLDAHGGDDGWMEHNELEHKPVSVTTVGMLFKRDDKGITVVLNRTDQNIGGYMFVPEVNIVSVTELKAGE
jgi:hypothetical protein